MLHSMPYLQTLRSEPLIFPPPFRLFVKPLTSLSGYFFFIVLSTVFVCDSLDVNDRDINRVTFIFPVNSETFPVDFRTDH